MTLKLAQVKTVLHRNAARLHVQGLVAVGLPETFKVIQWRRGYVDFSKEERILHEICKRGNDSGRALFTVEQYCKELIVSVTFASK